jgi:ferredoxin/flavodoxin
MMLKGIILYFSLTGNTKLACKYIKNKVQNVEFDLVDMRHGQANLSSYDIVGFATYSNEFSIARFVKNYIDDMPSMDKTAFVFSTFGRDNGNTTRDLAQSITRKGFKVVLDFALHTPENYPPVIKWGHGYENHPTHQELEEFNASIKRLSDIATKIENNEILTAKKITKKFSHRIMTKISRPSMMRYLMGHKKINADLCVQCKKCIEACPYDAIKMDSYPVFEVSKCNGCFACYNLCPTKAIYTTKSHQFVHYPRPNTAVTEKLKV